MLLTTHRVRVCDARLQVPPAKPHVFLICGASGVGKDAVVTRLQELRPDLYFVVRILPASLRRICANLSVA